MLIPSVQIYIRRHSTRKYERVRTRNPQMLGRGDTYCLHVWFKGRRKWITVDGDLNAALRRRMEEETKLILQKKEEATKEPPRLRVEDAVRKYLTKVEAMRSEATYSGYNYALAEFRKVCKKEFLADISRRDLEDFVVAMKGERLSDRTISNRVGEIITFLRWHDITNVKLAHKYMEKPAKAYRKDELDRLFAHANQDESDLFLFLLGTGARDQEAQHACWSDVDFHDHIFTVKEHPEYEWEPKDKQRREIELADNVLAMLKARKQRSKTELIFTAPLGGLHGHLLRDMVEPVARRAGIEDAGLHRFRKSYATILHRSGVDARTIQVRLGHSDLATTLAYLEAADVRSEDARAKVNNAFGTYGQEAKTVQ